jgi:ribosomal protein S18 acetylase RimI-like enzyme
VRIAGAADAAEVGRIFATGFADDPIMCWVFEEPRPAKLAVFFEFLAREAHVPLGACYLVDGACAAWTPPDQPPWPDERTARFVTTLAQTCTGADLERLAVLDDAMQAAHPAQRHWYLGVIGTEPAQQGRGLGTAVLAASLEAVDADGACAYLESSNPRNVPLYERHGFEVTGRIDLPGGPPLIPMWRDAR